MITLKGHTSQLSEVKPRLLDVVRKAVRARHYSRRTEEAYVGWIRRFILFHRKRHPADMGEREIGQFLSDLATGRRVSASTQNQPRALPLISRQSPRLVASISWRAPRA